MNTHEAYIALNMIEGVGPATFFQLRKELGCDVPDILQATRSQLMRVQGIGETTANAILNWESTIDLSAELQNIRNANCRVIILDDPEYPPLLRQIYNPPILLYIRGQLLTQDKNAISIVGSRMTTLYGCETAQNLARQLAYTGITIVSGGARGIDTYAHKGALAAKGRTISVLGNGLNRVYPVENLQLFDQIAENGAVISQFPMNRTADRQTFPIRNRIVAALGVGTIVVEANLKSGALITAGMAAELNRQVFAVPGRVDSPRSRGCHKLIKEGAKLCEDAQDVLSEFECLRLTTEQPEMTTLNDRVQPPQPQTQSSPQPPTEEQEELPFPLPTTSTAAFSITLTPDETTVLSFITTQEQHIDELIRASGLPCNIVQTALFGLEMKKQVKQFPGKLYRRQL